MHRLQKANHGIWLSGHMPTQPNQHPIVHWCLCVQLPGVPKQGVCLGSIPDDTDALPTCQS